MYSVPEALKTIYKNDFLPAVPQNYPKYLTLYFPELDLTIDTRTTGRIDIDSFSLDESLCSASDLMLGSCEASVMKIKINGIVQDLTGKKCIVMQHVNNEYEMPFGMFTVTNAGKQSDLGFKELTMFDSMIKSDIDVSAWYNALSWPQTVKSLRQSLLTYLGLQYEDQTVTNDTVQIPKTINPSTLSGRDVLKRLCEINVGFGHFTRSGKFKVIQLSGIGLYPSETLYPSEDLFPSESGEYISAGYETADYEEYIVESITSVTIREDDEDTGATSGVPGNPYIITGNFLLYGKTAAELQAITDNILLQVKNKYYRPHTTKMIGLPYMEVGDTVTIITSTDAIESFIFKRTLTGINSLKDEISAAGNQKRDQKVSPSTEIQQLKGKTLRIQKSVDELRVDLVDAAAGLEAMISFTAGELQTQITDNYNSLSSSITLTASQLQTQITDNKNDANSQFSQQADAIALRVEKAGVIAAINLSPETVKIQATNISLEGLVTVGEYVEITMDGKLKAVDGEFTGKITSNSAIITGGSFKVTALNQNDSRIVLSYSGYSSSTSPYGMVINGPADTAYASINPGELLIGNPASVLHSVDITSEGIQTPACSVAGYDAITAGNRNNYYYNSNRITPIYTGGGSGPNVGLNGVNIATVNWCNDTFEPKSPSDFRLKHDFKPLDELPDELYLLLKPWQYKFKVDTYGNGIFFGLLAQQVESAFDKYGYNALDYNLIEIVDSRDFTDEGQYVFDRKVHRVNYNNFHAWNLMMIQKIYRKVFGDII